MFFFNEKKKIKTLTQIIIKIHVSMIDYCKVNELPESVDVRRRFSLTSRNGDDSNKSISCAVGRKNEVLIRRNEISFETPNQQPNFSIPTIYLLPVFYGS